MAKIGINLNTASLQEEDIIFGIDLGTTNSLIAYMSEESGKPVVVQEANNTTLVPSVIYLGDEEVVVGDLAKEKLLSDPENTIYSVKRLVGKKLDDNNELVSKFNYSIIESTDDDMMLMVESGGKYYSVEELSSMILSELKSRVKHVLNKDVNKVVITVPAYFNDAQRQATRNAGKLAGMDVLRIINEPTAASLAYGIGKNTEEEKTVAVYDLGGGTFDISILHIEDGVFEVLSTAGDTMLGGDDIDQSILDFWKEKHPDLDVSKIKSIAEESKIALTDQQSYEKEYEGVLLEIKKDDLEKLVTPLIEKSLEMCQRAIDDAGLDKSDIDEIVLVGGSTRMPLIKEMVSDFFGTNVNDSLDPDQTVAIGAAVQADILAGNQQDLLLIDITPLSLGIETMGGLMDVLIPRNSKVPTSKTKQYTTQKDGQSGINISIYQGERDLVKDNILLGHFTLNGIPAMPATFPKVEVRLDIDPDGILNVAAKELRSGVEQSILLDTKKELDDSKVEKQLHESIKFAKDDRDERSIREAVVEAENIILATQSFISKNPEIVTQEEQKKTETLIDELRKSLDAKDRQKILALTEELNEMTTPMAARAMNKSIGGALKGKSI